MARRTVTVTHIRYSKKHMRGPLDAKVKDVSDLPGGGDLLTFIYGVWRGLRANQLWDRSKQMYCRPASHLTVGRVVVLAAGVGTYGDPSSVEEVETGERRLENDGSLANAIPLRVVALVPERETSAFLVIEHTEGGRFGQQFLDAVKRAWQEVYPEWSLHTETLTRSDAWFEQAQLESVSAEIYDHSADLADAGSPRHLGKVRVSLVPPKGAKYLPQAVLDALTARTADRRALLGLAEEPDEVSVTLGDGEQQKTFVLGKNKTPAVRILVTDYGAPALSDAAFGRWCAEQFSSYFSDVGVRWNTRWNRGDWTPEMLATEVRVRDA